MFSSFSSGNDFSSGWEQGQELYSDFDDGIVVDSTIGVYPETFVDDNPEEFTTLQTGQTDETLQIVSALEDIKKLLETGNEITEISTEGTTEGIDDGGANGGEQTTESGQSAGEERTSETESETEETTDALIYSISQDIKSIKEGLEKKESLQIVAWRDARLFYRMNIGFLAIIIGIVVVYTFIGRIK